MKILNDTYLLKDIKEGETYKHISSDSGENYSYTIITRKSANILSFQYVQDIKEFLGLIDKFPILELDLGQIEYYNSKYKSLFFIDYEIEKDIKKMTISDLNLLFDMVYNLWANQSLD